MALTRKLLKGMGLTDEQVDTIIEAHTETVDGLKKQAEAYKADAGKLPDVQKELDELRKTGDGGYREKYEKEHSDFEQFRADAAAKETAAQKRALYREALKKEGVAENRIDAIMKVTDLNDVKLKDGALEEADKVAESIRTNWADFIVQKREEGARVENPPAGGAREQDQDLGSMSMADYIAARKKK